MPHRELMFKKAKCKGFYKKAHDGKCIFLDEENLKAYESIGFDGCYEGEEVDRVEKTYYEYVEKRFGGFVVGFVDLVVKGYLDAIYQEPCDVGVGVIPEKFYVAKTPKEIVKCAIVYYANNKKHYVPVDMIEVIENE